MNLMHQYIVQYIADQWILKLSSTMPHLVAVCGRRCLAQQKSRGIVSAFRHNVSRYDLRFAMRTRQGWLQHQGFPATSPICSKSG